MILMILNLHLVVHYWYNFVEKTFPGGSMRNAIKKVACDQLLFAPIGMGLFLSVTTLMEGTISIN